MTDEVHDKRAAALAQHFDCPIEEIKVVEGMGKNVYTHVADMDQETAEQENGCWHVLTSDEAEEAARNIVGQSLHTYYAHALIEACEPNGLPDSFLLLMERAVQLYLDLRQKAPTSLEVVLRRE